MTVNTAYLEGINPSANLVCSSIWRIFCGSGKRLAATRLPFACPTTRIAGIKHADRLCGTLIEFCAQDELHGSARIELRDQGNRGSLWQTVPAEASSSVRYHLTAAGIDAYDTVRLARRGWQSGTAREQGVSCVSALTRYLCSDWKKHYDAMVAQAVGTLEPEKTADVRRGTFRISQDYLILIDAKNEPDSAAWVSVPLPNDAGVQLPDGAQRRWSSYDGKTCRLSSAERIFR